MRDRGRRILRALLPSVFAVVVSSGVAGFVDGWVNTRDVLQGAVAAGLVSVLAVPAGLALVLVARALWHAWQPGKLAAALTESTGGAPRLAAWLLFALGAGWALAGASFHIVRLLQRATSAERVISLATALLVTAVAAALAALSRPCVSGLTAALRELDRAVYRRLGRSVLAPAALAVAGPVMLAGLLAGAWLVSIRPRIGHLDIGFAYYLALFVALVAGLHGLWGRVPRLRSGLVLGAGAALAGLIGAATVYARHARPYSIISVWANTEVVGEALEVLYDIQSLRRELRVREFRPAERPGASHPDVVLITIDTLRADRLRPYGGRDVMPGLTELAQDGAVFEWAFSPGNVTRRSLPAIATGLHPTRISGRVSGWALRLDPRHVMVAERFLAAGYDTAGFFCCGSHFGPRRRLGLIRGIEHLQLKKDGAALARMAARWLAERDAAQPERPLFLWMHFIDPHLWESEYPSKVRRKNMGVRYDKSLTATDRALRTVLSTLWTDDRKDRTVIVVTADHGESLGDHGYITHATSLYNSEIRVPLVIAGPGIRPQRIEQPVGLVRVAPTLLDLAGFEPPGPPQMDGASLGPLLRGEVPDDLESGEAYSVMIKDRSAKFDMHALVRGRYKYIEREEPRRVQLFDFIADPDEDADLARDEGYADVVERLRERLNELRRTSRIPPF